MLLFVYVPVPVVVKPNPSWTIRQIKEKDVAANSTCEGDIFQVRDISKFCYHRLLHFCILTIKGEKCSIRNVYSWDHNYHSGLLMFLWLVKLFTSLLVCVVSYYCLFLWGLLHLLTLWPCYGSDSICCHIPWSFIFVSHMLALTTPLAWDLCNL